MRRKPTRLQKWRARLLALRIVTCGASSYCRETNFPYAAGLFVACAGITFVWCLFQPQSVSNLWPEMGGMTLDVFFILIVFGWFEHRRDRKQDVVRQREVIDDYKRWDQPEAHYRIAGAVRRLNRMGVSALELTGARLTKFEFARSGIESIEGSTFYDGRWGERIGDSTVKLVEVSFDRLNCQKVEFSPYNPLAGLGDLATNFSHSLNCSFMDSDLSNAKFNGSAIYWTDRPPETLMEYFDNDDGLSGCGQVSYGPFYQANLQAASFKGYRFKNADFRDADNILEADFTSAKGLEDACFDSDQIRAAVLAQAAGTVV